MARILPGFLLLASLLLGQPPPRQPLSVKIVSSFKTTLAEKPQSIGRCSQALLTM